MSEKLVGSIDELTESLLRLSDGVRQTGKSFGNFCKKISIMYHIESIRIDRSNKVNRRRSHRLLGKIKQTSLWS